ncbi:hypothetical protein F5148DRAFT_1284935 [Russula earlei]|uniref:Uncharacterized protein n=1 Tax=Russula earlei TaxID=71964 RepID=A0ACC0U800_9AGAM|nr:hypothetical protein F5148DRAFT_1284935 [Russula earlei]
MRTSGSAHVLALFCLAIGIAPLFAHASATHFDKRGLFGNAETVESISQKTHNNAALMFADIIAAQLAHGHNAPIPDQVRKNFGTRYKDMSQLEKTLQKIHYGNPTEHSKETLAQLRAYKDVAGQFKH